MDPHLIIATPPLRMGTSFNEQNSWSEPAFNSMSDNINEQKRDELYHSVVDSSLKKERRRRKKSASSSKKEKDSTVMNMLEQFLADSQVEDLIFQQKSSVASKPKNEENDVGVLLPIAQGEDLFDRKALAAASQKSSKRHRKKKGTRKQQKHKQQHEERKEEPLESSFNDIFKISLSKIFDDDDARSDARSEASLSLSDLLEPTKKPPSKTKRRSGKRTPSMSKIFDDDDAQFYARSDALSDARSDARSEASLSLSDLKEPTAKAPSKTKRRSGKRTGASRQTPPLTSSAGSSIQRRIGIRPRSEIDKHSYTNSTTTSSNKKKNNDLLRGLSNLDRQVRRDRMKKEYRTPSVGTRSVDRSASNMSGTQSINRSTSTISTRSHTSRSYATSSSKKKNSDLLRGLSNLDRQVRRDRMKKEYRTPSVGTQSVDGSTSAMRTRSQTSRSYATSISKKKNNDLLRGLSNLDRQVRRDRMKREYRSPSVGTQSVDGSTSAMRTRSQPSRSYKRTGFEGGALNAIMGNENFARIASRGGDVASLSGSASFCSTPSEDRFLKDRKAILDIIMQEKYKTEEEVKKENRLMDLESTSSSRASGEVGKKKKGIVKQMKKAVHKKAKLSKSTVNTVIDSKGSVKKGYKPAPDEVVDRPISPVKRKKDHSSRKKSSSSSKSNKKKSVKPSSWSSFGSLTSKNSQKGEETTTKSFESLGSTSTAASPLSKKAKRGDATQESFTSFDSTPSSFFKKTMPNKGKGRALVTTKINKIRPKLERGSNDSMSNLFPDFHLADNSKVVWWDI